MSKKKFSVLSALPPEVRGATPIAVGGAGDIRLGYVPEDADEYPDEDADDAFDDMLMECAVEWLPDLPQVSRLIDSGITLDYGVLVSARIAVEEFEDRVDETILDDMLAVLLLYGEDEAEDRLEYSELLSPSAQYLAAQMDLAMQGRKGRGIAEAELEARQLLWLGVLSDLTVATEAFEETGEPAALDDMQLSAKLFTLMCEQGDMPDHLVEQALALFNPLAAASELPLSLHARGAVITLQDDTPPAPDAPAAKPPKP